VIKMKRYVDLQVNGYSGIDFSAPGLTLDGIRTVTEELYRLGTLAFCPTVISSPPEVYEQNLPVLASAFKDPDLSPRLLGIHLEGPFISPLPGARGAHKESNIIPPDIKIFEHFRNLAEDNVCLLTAAPEIEGGIRLINHAAKLGITVSLGHHTAGPDYIKRAVDAGATAVTHLGNGISNMLPRHPNPIWDQLAEDRLTPMLITDGHHLPPSFIKSVFDMKGTGNIAIVSDSAPIAGLKPGKYNTLGLDVVLEKSGKLWVPEGNHLAGSSANIRECVEYLDSLEFLGKKALDAAAIFTPLRILGRATL
jgi:N-acetylglucosamine-6-phosphate deacetylase